MEFEPWGQPKPKTKAGENLAIDPRDIPDVETATQVATRDPHDPQPHMDRLQAVFQPEFEKLEARAVGITVNSEDANELAVEMMNQLDRFRIDLEKHRKKITGEPSAFCRAMNQFSKSWTDKAMVIKSRVAKKVKIWMFNQEKKRKEDERKALDEAERLRKKQEEAAKVQTKEEPFFDSMEPTTLSDIPPPAIPPPVIPRSTKTEVSTGKAQVKKVWKWAIVNFKDLPDDCFEERADLIEAAIAPWINTRIKAGLKVPGVDSWQEDDLKTSTKRKF